MRAGVHGPALVTALAVLAAGVVLLLDSLDVVTLTLGRFAPIALAIVGTILIAGGLASSEEP